jgi:hypothetical protein
MIQDEQPHPRGDSAERRARGTQFAAPIAIALLLCTPDFRFPFLFDDFEFLARAGMHGWSKFLPNPATLFYRPVSREGYFGLLLTLGAQDAPLIGHLLNFLLVCAGIILLGAVVSRLLGRRSGLIAAVLFASFGQIPALVAWVSGCQDLLMIDFVLLGLYLELDDHHALGLAAAILALLSKETAGVLLPVIALSGWILGRTRRPSAVNTLSYFGVLALWALIHPGLHLLAAGGFLHTQQGYLGLDNPDRWNSIAHGLLALLNLPFPGSHTAWPLRLTLPALASAGIVLAVSALALRPKATPASPLPPTRRVVLMAATIAGLPLIATSALVRHWAPYYVAVSAIGLCMILTAALRRMRPPAVAVALCAFLGLGVWERGMMIDPRIQTEANLYPAAQALSGVESQFKALRPVFPDSAQVLVLVLGRSVGSVRVHLYRLQAPRWWFRNPTLHVARPELRQASANPEFLYWIGRDYVVHEIDLSNLRPRSATHSADYTEYQKTMRAYAQGLADSGQLPKAVWILLHMPPRREGYQYLDRRIAAMLLFQHGREAEASSLLVGVPPIRAEDAVRLVAGFMTTPSRTEPQLDAAMRGFGLSPRDPEKVRAILTVLTADRAYPQVLRTARYLLRLRPGDPEAEAAVDEATRTRPADDEFTVQRGEE